MKKMIYSAPRVEIHAVELENMIALSLIGGGVADKDGEVLVDEQKDWNIWGE